MEFKGKEQRTECYKARDAYFECIDKRAAESNQKENCQDLFKIFEKTCGKKWADHFIKKKDYLKYKEKLEREGFESVDKSKIKV